MPIRNIIVDWGFQNRITGGNPGQFKNKKTRCSTNSAAFSCVNDVNVTCAGDNNTGNAECTRNDLGQCTQQALSFGNAPDACEKGFHEFFGSYNFQPDDAQCNYRVGENNPPGITTAALTSNGLSFGDRYCAFKPRVIIIDNWGWCNGTCAEGNGKGCWESDVPGVSFQRCSSGQHPDYATKVGTKFDGWVIVVEQK